jgi:hypothetical protein
VTVADTIQTVTTLAAAVRAVTIASDHDRPLVLQDVALRLAPVVGRRDMITANAVDALVDAAAARGMRRDDAEHIARMGLAGRSAGVGYVPPTVGGIWPAPDVRMIDTDRGPAPRLDDEALPAGWEAWIASEAASRACPRDYIAAALIGAASAWVDNARRVAATADWTEPAHLWFALIGPPSAGKTPALRPIIDGSRVLERDAEPAWRDALAQYECDVEAAHALDKAWRERVRTAVSDGATPPARPANAEEPAAPPRPRLVAMDTSIEELQRMLAENPRGLLYVRDELAGWLGGFDRYGGRGADRAFWLESWNGGRTSATESVTTVCLFASSMPPSAS